MRSLMSARAQPSAIWLRQEFPVQRNKMRGPSATRGSKLSATRGSKLATGNSDACGDLRGRLRTMRNVHRQDKTRRAHTRCDGLEIGVFHHDASVAAVAAEGLRPGNKMLAMANFETRRCAIFWAPYPRNSPKIHHGCTVTVRPIAPDSEETYGAPPKI